MGAFAVAFVPEERLDEVLAALGFLAAGVTGLVGVIGTFRPRARGEPDPQPDLNQPEQVERSP